MTRLAELLSHPPVWSLATASIGGMTLALGVSLLAETPRSLVPPSLPTETPGRNSLGQSVAAADEHRCADPPDDDTLVCLTTVLLLDPTDNAARESLRYLLSSYVEMARQSDVAGHAELSARYLEQAQSILFGTSSPVP